MKGAREAPRVEVVVLNWNRAADTIRCIEALHEIDYPDFGVIVVDNGSRDESVPRIREAIATLAERGAGPGPTVELVPNGDNLGFAGGVNRALETVLEQRAAARYVWILNNDAVPDPAALSALVARAEGDPRCGLIGSTVVSLDHGRLQAAGGGRLNRWTGGAIRHGEGDPFDPECLPSARLDFIYGASLLVRTDMIRAVGLMDELFFVYSEEIDWALRATRAGWRLAYAPASLVRHAEGASTDAARPLRDFHGVRGQLLVVRKHFTLRFPVALLYSLYRHLLPKLVRGEWSRLRAVLRAYGSIRTAPVRTHEG